MGCSDCASKGGCDVRKGEQRLVFDDVLARVYPTRTWGRPDDEARFGAGVSRGEARRAARALAEVLEAPAFFRDGGEDDLCHFVYVLCVGRRPALVELRDDPAALDVDIDGVRERYLRVALSSVARLATVQEVELTGHGDGALVREAPRAGVYDAVLLKRVRKLTAWLAAADLVYCDFGLLDRPVADADPGDYVERFGEPPRLASFLFFAAPPTTATTATLTPGRVRATAGRGAAR